MSAIIAWQHLIQYEMDGQHIQVRETAWEKGHMAISSMSNIEKLDQEDKDKVSYFMQLLLRQAKYQTLKQEIALRREEIQHGETLSHEAVWAHMDV